MIIVAGRIHVRSGTREQFLRLSADAMTQARQTPACRDFVVAADPLDPDRVNVYEEWESREALHAFREAGPDDGLSKLVERASVAEHEVELKKKR